MFRLTYDDGLRTSHFTGRFSECVRRVRWLHEQRAHGRFTLKRARLERLGVPLIVVRTWEVKASENGPQLVCVARESFGLVVYERPQEAHKTFNVKCSVTEDSQGWTLAEWQRLDPYGTLYLDAEEIIRRRERDLARGILDPAPIQPRPVKAPKASRKVSGRAIHRRGTYDEDILRSTLYENLRFDDPQGPVCAGSVFMREGPGVAATDFPQFAPDTLPWVKEKSFKAYREVQRTGKGPAPVDKWKSWDRPQNVSART